MKQLGFGTMRMPLLNPEDQTDVDISQVCRMVDTFLEQGFTYFDTAYMYHEYASEKIVKKVLTERYPRESYQLATKLPTMMLKEKEDMERIFEEQLEKCGVSYFDYYLLHCLNVENYEICNKLGAFEFVQEKKKEGKIKKIGFSFHDSAEVLETILKEHPEMEFVQLQINYLDWDSPNVQSGKCHELAVQYGKDIIVMEPVKGGTLAKLPQKAEELLKAAEPQQSIASWAVRYAASLPNVFMVLSGMSNYEQMLDNTAYMKDFKTLTEKEMQMLEDVVDIIHESIAIPCTACKYCVEGCPKNIPIPDYFKLYNQYAKFGEGSHTRGRYDELTKEHGKAADCIACGNCERHCPQNLPIIHEMTKVADVYDK